MNREPAPSDEFLQQVEALDEALRRDPNATDRSGVVPRHVMTGLQVLHSAFQDTKTSTEDSETDFPQEMPSKCETLGRFRLYEQLGAGSFGVVYRAVDTVLKREVALKLPRLMTTLSDDLSQRFLRESEAAARLHHPHIVPVFEAGFLDATCYIAAEYCPGRTLEAWLTEQTAPVDSRAAAKMLLHLADAVDHAHQAGILHRDLKPGNILLDEKSGETKSTDAAVLDQARIADFGLARFLDESASTVAGGLVGTLAYMSPEQAGQSKEPVGPASDIYAVGVILYEVLTGVRPHEGQDPVDTLRQICEKPPARLRRLRPELPRDLESICLKCLEKNPRKRYPAAAVLREDLKRFLEGRATIARPLSLVEQTLRAAIRYPARATSVLILIVTVALGIAGSLYHFDQMRSSIQHANEQRRLAERRERQVTDLLYVADLRMALIALQQGNRRGFESQLERYRHQPDIRGIEWDFLNATIPNPLRDVAGHDGPIYAAALSPDGTSLATVGKDAIVRLWNPETGMLKAELKGHTNEINDLAFHPSGDYLATSSDDKTVRLWDLDTFKTRRVLEHADVVYGLAFAPDGDVFVSGGQGKRVRIWTADGNPIGELGPFKSTVDDLVFSADGILAIAKGRAPELWDLESRNPITKLPGRKLVFHLDFSPDGRFVAGGTYHQEIMIWDRVSGRLLARWGGHRAPILDVAFSPLGDSLYSCGRDGTVRKWPLLEFFRDVEEHEITNSVDDNPPKDACVFQAHPERAWSLVFCPHQKMLITTGNQGEIRFWSREQIWAPRAGLLKHNVFQSIFSRDRRNVFLATENAILIWNSDRGEIDEVLTNYPSKCSHRLSLSQDGNRLAVGLQNGQIALESLNEETRQRVFLDNPRPYQSFSFSPADDSLFFLADAGGMIRVYDVKKGYESRSHEILNHADGPIEIALSPDGSRIAYSNGIKTVVRHTETWQVIAEWESKRGTAVSLAFGPRSLLLAAAHSDHTIELRDLETGETERLAGHEDRVLDIVFSQDGRTLFSVSADGTLRAWHTASAQEIGILYGGSEILNSIALSHDGRILIASHGNDGKSWKRSKVLLWDARKHTGFSPLSRF